MPFRLAENGVRWTRASGGVGREPEPWRGLYGPYGAKHWGSPPDAGSLLRLPLLLDGGNAPLWGIAPAKTRGQSEQRPGVGRDTQ
eukprot:4072290-Prymnesium_polylepis.1